MLSYTLLDGSTSVVELDDESILIDCGWNPGLDADLSVITNRLDSLRAVLLTHATISHIGAYVYLCATNPAFAALPCYATVPVVNLGRMVTLEFYRAKGLLGPLASAKVTVAEVERIFDAVTTVKYSQSVTLGDKLEGTTITAFNAGHTLGGTLWRIQKDQENLLFAVDWNHSRDSHLSGAILDKGQVLSSLKNPSVLITGSKTSHGSQNSRQRREALLDNIRQTLDRGGTVVIPVSTARLLELVHILDAHWDKNNIKSPLVCLSYVGSRILAYASSMLEWMSSQIIDDWQVRNQSPFDTKKLKIVNSMEALNRMGDTPKVVLAVGADLDVGLSTQLFASLCVDPNSQLLLIEEPQQNTLASRLYQLWKEHGRSQLAVSLPVSYTVSVPLSGAELKAFNETVTEERKRIELQQAYEVRNKNILEEDVEDSSEDDEEDQALDAGGDMNLGMLVYGNAHDYDVRKMTGKKMFPYVAKRRRLDDYGEILQLDHYQRAKEDTEEQQQAAQDTVIGERRKWENYSGETAKLDPMSSSAAPVKLETRQDVLAMACFVDFVDMQGLVDERSLEMIVPQLHSRNIVLLGDDSNQISQLKVKLPKAYIAEALSALNLSVNSHSYSVKVSEELEKLLKWQSIMNNEYQVAHITGKLITAPESNENLIVPLQTPEEFALAPHTDPLMVGDIKLAELKRKLVALGHRAEFRAEGILVCDDKVAIRKVSEGRIIIDGSIDSEFYETKRVVRNLLALV